MSDEDVEKLLLKNPSDWMAQFWYLDDWFRMFMFKSEEERGQEGFLGEAVYEL